MGGKGRGRNADLEMDCGLLPPEFWCYPQHAENKNPLKHKWGKKEIRSEAITHYNVIDSNNNYSVLKLIPETGRKHQLRKQLLMHGHPIIGDNKYRIGDLKFRKKNHMMLHAWKISFSVSGIKYNFSANLPIEFQNLIKEKRLKIY